MTVSSLMGRSMLKVWWCNQGQCWDDESGAGVVCAAASESTQGGTFRRTVGQVRRGDLTVHYVKGHSKGILAVSRAKTDGRQARIRLEDYGVESPKCYYGDEPGWLFEAEYHRFERPIPKDRFAGKLGREKLTFNPIDATGDVKGWYFMPFDLLGLQIIRRSSAVTWPDWAEGVLNPLDHPIGRAVAREERSPRTQEYPIFNPRSISDARRRIVASIIRRQGQPAFRRQLLEIYGGRCAISGADAEEALEVAHIHPYMGKITNHPRNGLLLRADLHTLFDQGLIAVDPRTMTVMVARKLMGTCYEEFHGKPLRLPEDKAVRPSEEALESRLNEFKS